MSLVQAIILGIVQGLTEFLPVSSSGHLVLGQALLGIDAGFKTEFGVIFEVFAHFGTLLAVVTVFWNDIWKMVKAFFSIFTFQKPLEERYHTEAHFRLMVLLILGSVPAGVLGLALEEIIEGAFSSPLLVCFMLLVTGAILFASRYFYREDQEMNTGRALMIGFAQAVAMVPGISRSGSTIGMALFWGIDRENAARFSFLLSLPVIAGATLLKTSKLFANPPAMDLLLVLFAGTIAAYLSGVIAIKLLLNIVRKGRLSGFAYYCFAVGILGIIWFIFV